MYNSLIRGYSNSSSKLESFTLLQQMMAAGFTPNNFTFPFVLKSISGDSAFMECLALHSLIKKTGFGLQVVVMNALLHVYVSCEQISHAHKVFDEMPHRSIVSWNSIIGGYCQLGDFNQALALFGAMKNSWLEPDEFTLATLLSACSKNRNLKFAKILHHYTVMTEIDKDLIVGNALLDMYGKCKEPAFAQICFDRMLVKNVVSWTSLICAYSKNGLLYRARCCFDQMRHRSTAVPWNAMIACYVLHDQIREAFHLYEQMQTSGVDPDEITLLNILSACSQIGNLVMGKRTHEYILQNISKPSVTLVNSVIDMYAKCARLDVAFSLFNRMKKKNVVSWNVVIGAFAIHGFALEAIELFGSLIDEGCFPDAITFVGLLSACSHGGLLEAGEHYFKAMEDEYNVEREVEHYACMVDLFGRRGQLNRAIELIITMPMKPDAVVWGALLGACRIHGDMRIAMQVMKQMLQLEGCSNGGLYVLMANLFCEAERWDDARRLRKMMNEGGVRKGKGRSLIEISGQSHEFAVEDVGHESSSDVCSLLDQLTDHLMSFGSCSTCLEE
ncbi:Pentatricopeptide repeat-containing protein [Apostasia shenzhenica]|uniref:Pentatricopeptide repeat-containing protein n=1 Tax=Apostasia shenzhenica TaxID=1088818 RepID=A0A2I0AS79_9ASPA|nr:Pentatricopeptide repeat-containing protein [Apostasia shenzhenica]